MSYISAEKIKDNVLIWERNEDGTRTVTTRKAPYYFYTKDPNGKYNSMYGDKLSRQEFATTKEFNDAKLKNKLSGIPMFESDIPAELRVLSKEFYNVKAPKLHVTFLDIEVDYDPEIGFSSIEDPYAPINAVALMHMWKKKYVILAIPPNMAERDANEDEWELGDAPEEFVKMMNDIAELPKDIDIEIKFLKNEKELLIVLLDEIQDSDLLCGWNSEYFDHPYIAKRVEKLGMQYLRKLSFPNAPAPKYRTVEVLKQERETVLFGGRIGADYLILFRKYEMTERPSYKLESIAEEMLPNLPKLEYEGSLATLYRNNFAWFVRYNIRDTEILEGLENRLGYVELANQMMHLSTANWKHVGGTLKLAELAVINYCHNELEGGMQVVNDFHHQEVENRIQGAFVLIPQKGLQKYTASIDINSLYPSAIRAINISPETLMGQFEEKEKAVDIISRGLDISLTCKFDNSTQVPDRLRGETLTATGEQWKTHMKKLNWAISGYGTVFNQTEQGVVPKILEDWYATRKKFQKMKFEATDDISKTYYDKMQYTYKIKLNAFYGALTNEYFRFFDQRLGESTTGTGRMILLHQCAKTCELLDGEYAQTDIHETEVTPKGVRKDHYGFSKKYSVVYGDTDSTYFLTHAKNDEQAIMIADHVGEKVNDSFQEYMKRVFLCNDGYDDIIKCGRENVSDKGIYVDKKMYTLHIIDSEGEKVDKMKVMGLATKKTTLPKHVAKRLDSFVERFLKDEEWSDIALNIVEYKEELEQASVMDIGLPKGIKKVEQYTRDFARDEKTRLPGHIAAAIHYNKCLQYYDDKESPKIMTGMKIKVFYLTKKNGFFKSIALPVDIEEVPKWFLDNFEVNVSMHIERLIDKPLNSILFAIGKRTPTRQELLADDLLVF